MRAQALANLPILQATDRAEARGHAMATLELIEQDLKHRQVLPRWATSRWILEQAAQSLDNRGRHRALQAIDVAVETRGGEGTLIGTDRFDARTKVIDHDWVFRQVLRSALSPRLRAP